MSKEMRQYIDNFNKFRLSENLNISDVRSGKKSFNSEMGLKLNDDIFRNDFGSFIDDLRHHENFNTWSSYHIGDLILQYLIDNDKIK
jgi:hypothetical protein